MSQKRYALNMILGLILVLLLLFVIVPIPMGEGSASYAKRWSDNFLQVKTPDEAIERYPEIDYRQFENGEWVIGVCSDSHNNPWGGTVVTKDSNGTVKSFFGHVCGSHIIQMPMSKATSLKDFYANLRGFKEHPIE